MPTNFRSDDKRYRFDPLRDGPVAQDLTPNEFDVIVRTRDQAVDQIRLDLVRAEVGNGNSHNSIGNLGARLQAEIGSDVLFGPVSYFTDEGIVFRTQSPHVKFDVRDVVGPPAGLFDVVVLGTSAAEDHVFSLEKEDHYVNAGVGNDRVFGGLGNDYLIGASGDDLVEGRAGNDVLVGGPGNDRLVGGSGNDMAVYRPAFDGSDIVDLGSGDDIVQVFGPAREIRLTWSTFQTGNGDQYDIASDGGLNVRFQSEDSAGNLSGPISRYDDEGISFIGLNGVTFDLRNLSDGAVRGNGYSIVRLGSAAGDNYDDSATSLNVFHNGGMGDDRLVGGSGADHLVGLDGDDWIAGGAGDDLLVGLAGSDTFVFSGVTGSDRILTYQPGVDKIDLSAYGIGLDDVQVEAVGPNAFVRVDTDGDDVFDFQIFLGGTTPPLEADFIF